MSFQAIIGSRSLADKIENLRRISYHNSTAFSIKNEQEFESYCRWSSKDDSGIVLAILDQKGEVVSSLRANVYFDADEHESNNRSFAGHTENFITYPAPDMTFATTAPHHFKSGFLSVLRYYMYFMHRHAVKSISGQVVKESTSFFALHKLDYCFKEIDGKRQDTAAVNKWVLANLEAQKFDNAIELLKTRYKDSIGQIPLMINTR